jgi:hypothetical protein
MYQSDVPKQNDLRRLQSLVPFITNKAVDQDRIGTFGLALNVVTNASANGEFTVNHPLARVPNGYILIRSSKGGQVYDPTDGSARWTTKTLVLRDTVAGDVVSLLLI